MRKLYVMLIALLAFAPVVFIHALPAKALVNTLNGQGGLAQTFSNDTNVTISSSGNVHTIGWSGTLQASRGGTGANMSTFSSGSLLFYNGSGVAQNNANLSWNNSTNTLTANSVQGANGSPLSVSAQGDGQSLYLIASDGVTQRGGDIGFNSGNGTSGQQAGNVQFTAGTGDNAPSGNITMHAGLGNNGYAGGTVDIYSGDGQTGGGGGHLSLSGANLSRGADATLFGGIGAPGGSGGGTASIQGGDDGSGGTASVAAGGSVDGSIRMALAQTGDLSIDPGFGTLAFLDFDAIQTSNRTFTFPDASGTISLLESDQTFSGINTFSNPVNNFVSSTNSTVHIGADGFPGCIVMGDDDSSGVTYITANDGVLSATDTPPANCN